VYCITKRARKRVRSKIQDQISAKHFHDNYLNKIAISFAEIFSVLLMAILIKSDVIKND
jgi:hypothetical protein